MPHLEISVYYALLMTILHGRNNLERGRERERGRDRKSEHKYMLF